MVLYNKLSSNVTERSNTFWNLLLHYISLVYNYQAGISRDEGLHTVAERDLEMVLPINRFPVGIYNSP